jgi:hypothetical protein
MEGLSTYYLYNNNKKEKFIIEVHLIKSGADLIKYGKYLERLPNNPFINKDLITRKPNEQLGYFTLHDRKDTLLVLLPFIYRKILINNKETGYYDIISPYGFAGPLINSMMDPIIMKQFWEKVDAWYLKHNVVSEFIRFNFKHNIEGFTGSIIPTLKMVHGRILPEKELWKNFRPKVRNNIRKALSFGLKGRIYYKDIPDHVIEEFYNIYIKTMDRHGAEMRYRHRLEYFINFFHNNPLTCAVACIYLDSKPVSTELLLLSENTIYSFLGGTDEAYFFTRPNDFLKWEVMKWGYEFGFTEYHLGGGKQENDSLYKFKKRFFPYDEDRIFYTGRKILLPDIYDSLARLNQTSDSKKSTEFFPLYRSKEK